MLQVIELFAGIGAQHRALQKANVEHEVIAISEIDKYAIQTYNAIHGEIPNLGDITKIERLPKADLWTYSFPCTDISLAGKMSGFEKDSGTHSSLLWEVQRLLNTAKGDGILPKYLLMENVKNLVSKKFKPLFDEWCAFLEELGYKNFYKVLNAKDYGIPQNRERIFMISIRDNNSLYQFPSEINLDTKLGDYLESNVDEKYYLSSKLIDCFTDMKNRNGLFSGLQFTSKYIARDKIPTLKTSHNDITIVVIKDTDNYIQWKKEGFFDIECRAYKEDKVSGTLNTRGHMKVLTNDLAIRKLTPLECFRLMGFEDEDYLKIKELHISDTQAYKMAGNSIVVNCLTEIFKKLKEII